MTIIAALVTLVFVTGCMHTEIQTAVEEAKIPVKILEVESKTVDDTVSYVGVVNNDQMVKKSFKVQGRVLNVLVDEGAHVFAGDELVTLEPLDLDFALEAAQADLISAKAQVSKAQDAYAFAKDNAEDSKVLYDQGAISKLNYDQAVLNLDLANSDLRSANEQYRQARVALDQKKNMRSESILYAPFDGQVISVLVEEGEMVSAGYPVLVISNDKKIMYTGVSQSDVQRIDTGMPAQICIDDKEIEGVVRGVNLVPDSQTRTYQVTVNMKDSSFPVGAVGDVKITLGSKDGIKIPIQSVLSTSIDYVFAIEDGIAVKKIIELGEVEGTDVFVTGLDDGELLVVEGMKNLKNLSEVQVVNE